MFLDVYLKRLGAAEAIETGVHPHGMCLLEEVITVLNFRPEFKHGRILLPTDPTRY